MGPDAHISRPRRLLILGICCMSLLIVGLDTTIVNVALPSIRKELHASVSGLQWTIDAYTLVLASLLMLAGSRQLRFKLNTNWVLLGAAGYDIHHNSITQTQIGAGYIDDCVILALSYITSYAYSGSVSVNHSYMMQLTLRTLGGTSSTSAAGAPMVTPGVFGSTH